MLLPNLYNKAKALYFYASIKPMLNILILGHKLEILVGETTKIVPEGNKNLIFLNPVYFHYSPLLFYWGFLVS